MDEGARKKLRGQRACDLCRSKKIRCNAPDKPDGICSACAEQGIQCKYIDASRRRTAPKWYVEKMEDRMEKMEQLLRDLRPGSEFPELGPPMERGSWENAQPEQFAARPGGSKISPKHEDSGDQATEEVQRLLQNFRLGGDGRYYGASSNAAFIRAAVTLKPGYEASRWSEWAKGSNSRRRKQFWTPGPWKVRSLAYQKRVPLEFPPPDLMREFVDLFFAEENILFPILHRPTFLSQLEDGLHERDYDFAMLAMMVCASGARWSNDMRGRESESLHSAGWKYFEQVFPSMRPLGEPPTLLRLQTYAAAVLFLSGSGSLQINWMVVGDGLRLCQDIGAHLKATFHDASIAEQEAWKRCFWTMFVYDTILSAALDRTCTFHEEDFDVDPPLEVDDEFWFHPDPDKAFVQPPDVPSTVCYFTQMTEIMIILSNARRSLFPVAPRKIRKPVPAHEALSSANAALHNWLDNLPPHLKWNPHSTNKTHLMHASFLQLYLQQAFFVLHRAFIAPLGDPNKPPSPSLVICTNAARTSSGVLEVLRRRDMIHLCHSFGCLTAFHAAIILLLGIWGSSGGTAASVNYSSQISDVHICMQTLSDLQHRWVVGGKLLDVLEELASVGDFPLPEVAVIPPRLKRSRSEDDLPIIPSTSTVRAHRSVSTHGALPPTSDNASSSNPVLRIPNGILPPPLLPVTPLDYLSSDFFPTTSPLPNTTSPIALTPHSTSSMHNGTTPSSSSFPPTPSDARMGDWGHVFHARYGLSGGLPSSLVVPLPHGADQISVDTLLHLWSSAPMGTGFDMWDGFDTHPASQPGPPDRPDGK